MIFFCVCWLNLDDISSDLAIVPCLIACRLFMVTSTSLTMGLVSSSSLTICSMSSLFARPLKVSVYNIIEVSTVRTATSVPTVGPIFVRSIITVASVVWIWMRSAVIDIKISSRNYLEFPSSVCHLLVGLLGSIARRLLSWRCNFKYLF